MYRVDCIWCQVHAQEHGITWAVPAKCHSPWHRLKTWISGYSRYSKCWLGQHRWDWPGGHCERCGKCDEMFGSHGACKRREE